MIELLPSHEVKSTALYASLVLLSQIYDAVFQESCSKKYAFITLGSGCFEIILALLIEVVAFYILVIIIQVRIPRFKRPIRIVSGLNWGRGDY